MQASKKTHTHTHKIYKNSDEKFNKSKKLQQKTNINKTNYVIIKRLEGINILNQLINLNKMSYYKQKPCTIERCNLFLDFYVCCVKRVNKEI